MARARLAVVGGGKFGEMHLRAFSQLQREGRAELVGLADIAPEVRERRAAEYGVATFSDFRELLDKTKPDGLGVVTPDFLHREIVLEALRRGVHVLCEKPLDVSVAGCREMTTAAEERGLLLQVDFHKRYDPYHRAAYRKAREGKLGRVQYGYAWMEDRLEVPRDWFPHWARHSSPVWFLGVHMLDLARWLIGADGARVYATGSRGKLDSLGVETWDAVQTHVEFAGGANFTVHAAWILPDGFEAVVNQGLRLVGTEGLIEIDSQNRGAEMISTAEEDGRPRTWNLGFLSESRDKAGNQVYTGYGIEAVADFAHNVNHLLDGGTLADLAGTYPDGRDGTEVSKLAAAAHRSLETGAVVDCSAL